MSYGSRRRVLAVVPALNEVTTILGVVRDLKSQVDEVWVVDDGSTDRTGEIARDAGARVVRHARSLGYDRSISDGFAAAAQSGADILVTFDADGQHNAQDVPRILGPLLEDRADLVVGMRPTKARAAEKLYAQFTLKHAGIHDPLCGLKAYDSRVYRAIGAFDTVNSIGTQLMLESARRKFRLREVPIQISMRADTPRFGHRVRANSKIGWAMARVIAEHYLRRPRGHKVAAIVQARMGSSRCPGKVLKLLAGRPLLAHVVQRLRKARNIHQVVVATTVAASNRPIMEYCRDRDIPLYAGPEDTESNVLERFRLAAAEFSVDTIVRVTSDCPLVDPALLDRLVEEFRSGSWDCLTNRFPRSYPVGLDVDIFSSGALGHASRVASTPVDREHVVPVFLKSSNGFRVRAVESPRDLSPIRVTVDEELDFRMIEQLLAELGEGAGLKDLERAWSDRPALFDLNRAAAERHEQRNKNLMRELAG